MKGIISGLVIGLLAAAAHSEGHVTQWRVDDGGNGHWYEFRDGPTTWDQAIELSELATYQGISGHLGLLSAARR